MKTYACKTYGCSMNYSDTERVASVLESLGYSEIEDIVSADIAVLNTCSIKQKAEDKVFSTINNIHKKRKKEKRDTRIIITGCMVKKTSSQTDEERDPLLTRIPNIDIVMRIEDTGKLPELLGIAKVENPAHYLSIIPKYKNHFQAIVPIQTGCDNFCTFCVVPYTRGREQSRPAEQILREIKSLATKGVKEVILVGQNVNSYGKGLAETKRKFDEEHSKWLKGSDKTPFSLLLEQVSAIEGIERIRFQSSNPHDITDDIIETICHQKKIMPTIHFALQSGDNEVLKRMNRKHTFEQYLEIVKKIRSLRPDFEISTDIIVGFTDESEEAFENTMKAVQKIDVSLIYISEYSLRAGTTAAKLMPDNIPASVKHARFHTLNNWLKTQVKRKLQTLVGTTQKVLLENRNKHGFLEGKTEHNFTCQILEGEGSIGDIIPVKITDVSTWSLSGVLQQDY